MLLSTLKKFCDQFSSDSSGNIAELLGRLKSGEAKLVVPSYEHADFAPLLQELRGVLPSISRIVQEPLTVLRGELTLRRAETATVLSPTGIRETLHDMRLWKVKGGALRPEYVYAPENTEESDLYENRLVKALIDRCLRVLSLCVGASRENVRILRDMHLQGGRLNKVDFIRLLGNRMDSAAAPSGGEYREAISLRKKFLRLRDTRFYKTMNGYASFTDSEPRGTSIFAANRSYRNCFALWHFLNRFESNLTGLSGEQRRSAYTAYVAFALAASYEKLGYTLERNVYYRDLFREFSFAGLVFRNDTFRIVLDAVPGRIDLIVQCPQEKVQQRMRIGVYPNTSDEPSAGDFLSVGLFDIGYGDRFVCARPENADSPENLLAVAKLTAFTFGGDASLYDSLCPVCGSTLVTTEPYCHRCEDCNSRYRAIGKDKIWINSFELESAYEQM